MNRPMVILAAMLVSTMACQPPPPRPSPQPEPTLPVLLPSELGLSEPMPLDVLFSTALFTSEEPDAPNRAVYAALTSGIIDSAFSRSLAAKREDWLATQKLLVSDRSRLPALFRFPTLLVAQVSEDEGPASLRIRIFDLSCTDYRDLGSGTFVPSTWERALIFEETRELPAASAGDGRAFGWSLIEAWKEALTDLGASRRFMEYREHLARGPLDTASNGTTLLGVIPEGTNIDESTALLFADSVSDLWAPSEQHPVVPSEPVVPPSGEEPTPADEGTLEETAPQDPADSAPAVEGAQPPEGSTAPAEESAPPDGPPSDRDGVAAGPKGGFGSDR